VATTITSSAIGTQTDSIAYVIGGPAVAHEVANVGPSTTSAAWEGGVLVFKSTVQAQGMQIPVTSRWTLAPDGKSLTVARAIGTSGGDMTIRMLFDRK
jgi:hypothetical protein